MLAFCIHITKEHSTIFLFQLFFLGIASIDFVTLPLQNFKKKKRKKKGGSIGANLTLISCFQSPKYIFAYITQIQKQF